MVQGISGAATLGAAQAPTGAKHKQFTVFGEEASSVIARLLRTIAAKYPVDAPHLIRFYDDPRNANSFTYIEKHSEEMTAAIVNEMAGGESIECVVAVFVEGGGDMTHDERKIIGWDSALPPRVMPKPGVRRRRP